MYTLERFVKSNETLLKGFSESWVLDFCCLGLSPFEILTEKFSKVDEDTEKLDLDSLLWWLSCKLKVTKTNSNLLI